MKIKFLILFFTLVASATAYAQGTNLRGQVITNYYNQRVPLVTGKVDLYIYDANRAPGYQWILVATTLTDAYGFYFFRGINPGFYTIWINELKSYNIQVIPIDYRYYTYQDLPQFIF